VRAFLDRLDPALHRVPGTAVFMTGHLHVVPPALLHNVRHNKVLHHKVVLVTARARDVPRVPEAQRVTVERLGKGFYRVAVSHGFMDEPDVPRALGLCRAHGLPVDPAQTSYFLLRETLVPSPRPELGPLEERLFMLLSAGSLSATAYFRIPPTRWSSSASRWRSEAWPRTRAHPPARPPPPGRRAWRKPAVEGLPPPAVRRGDARFRTFPRPSFAWPGDPRPPVVARDPPSRDDRSGSDARGCRALRAALPRTGRAQPEPPALPSPPRPPSRR
jgi:hypothetical protein